MIVDSFRRCLPVSVRDHETVRCEGSLLAFDCSPMAKSVHDTGWTAFVHMLEYQARLQVRPGLAPAQRDEAGIPRLPFRRGRKSTRAGLAGPGRPSGVRADC